MAQWKRFVTGVAASNGTFMDPAVVDVSDSTPQSGNTWWMSQPIPDMASPIPAAFSGVVQVPVLGPPARRLRATLAGACACMRVRACVCLYVRAHVLACVCECPWNACLWNMWAWSVCPLTLPRCHCRAVEPTVYTYVAVAFATVDSDWAHQPNPDPAVPPQSHVVNARTNPAWHRQNNGFLVQGRTYFVSAVS